MALHLSYGKTTLVVAVLACWNLAFRRYSHHPDTLQRSPAGLDPWLSVIGYFFFGLALGGLLFCLLYRNRPAGNRRRTWYGIEGTTADFVYLYASATLAGMSLHTASFR